MNIDIVNDFKIYAKNPARWVNRYLNQCSPKEDYMGTGRQRYKIVFEFIKDGKKFRWRARSSNGRIICTSDPMIQKQAPRNTVENMVECIKLSQYRISSHYED